MTSREKIIDILENDVMVILGENKNVKIPSKNGMISTDFLEIVKKEVLLNTISHLKDELVSYKKHYPNEEYTVVDFNTEYAVIKLEDFIKLKELLNE